MRSSKSRSRSKQNRPRSLGNIVNRVFDSSGPEGKVRGTPQQIIEKYLVLARDAQLGNDRVASENFMQHAEHYIRMLAEAQREMAREQEARNANNQNQNNNNNSGNGSNAGGNNGHQGGHQGGGEDSRNRRERDDGRSDQRAGGDVIDFGDNRNDSNLVETPEQRQQPRPQEAAAQPEAQPQQPAGEPSEAPAPKKGRAAAGDGERKPRRPRRPRKTEGGEEAGGSGNPPEGGESQAPAAE